MRASELTRPAFLSALVLLLVNDHFLKGAGVLPGWLTGKLSDFAGLFVFPVLLFVALRLVLSLDRRSCTARTVAMVCSVATTTIVFAAVNLSTAANGWFTPVWGVIVVDPTDLVALPMCLVAGWWLAREPRRADESNRRPRFELVVAIVAALACVATSPAKPRQRGFPTWCVVDAPPRPWNGVPMKVWAARSGKDGTGILVEATNPSPNARSLVVTGAELRVFRIESREEPYLTIRGQPSPPKVELGPGQTKRLYLPFRFDNEDAWNSEARSGQVGLRMRLDGGEPVWWRLDMQQVYHGYVETVSPRQKDGPGANDPCPAVFETAEGV